MSSLIIFGANQSIWMKLTFHPGKVNITDSQGNSWSAVPSDGPGNITDKGLFDSYLDFNPYPTTPKQALEAYMYCTNPEPELISQPMAALVDVIVTDYLLGKLTWFQYKNETYTSPDGSSIVRKSDGKSGSLPTTGSEFGGWDPRTISFN